MADYSINAVTRRVVFSGSAGTGPYAFSFEVLTETDIAVYFNATLLTLTTDYTVTVNANGTGSVTIVTGSGVPSTPVSSDQITIVGSRDIERTTDFVTAGDFRASAINEQLDSQIIMIQQVAEENKRGLRAPTYDPALVEDGGVLDLTLPTKDSRAGKILAFDSNGNPAVGEDIGNYRGDWAASTAYSVRDLVKDTSTNNIFRANTAHTSSGSQPLTTNTDSAKWDLVVDAASASASAAAASASATAAASSAAASATSATSSASSASSASTAQSAAEAAQAAAETAQAAAELAADNFDDTYLGAKASDPTVDNDGDALTTGDLYFNTTSNELKVYNGSAWQVAAISAAGLLTASNNLSDLASAATARTNLGLETVGQAEAEAGTATTERAWTAQRVKQAIDALGSSAVDMQVFSASGTWTKPATGTYAFVEIWGAGGGGGGGISSVGGGGGGGGSYAYKVFDLDDLSATEAVTIGAGGAGGSSGGDGSAGGASDFDGLVTAYGGGGGGHSGVNDDGGGGGGGSPLSVGGSATGTSGAAAGTGGGAGGGTETAGTANAFGGGGGGGASGAGNGGAGGMAIVGGGGGGGGTHAGTPAAGGLSIFGGGGGGGCDDGDAGAGGIGAIGNGGAGNGSAGGPASGGGGSFTGTGGTGGDGYCIVRVY